MDLALVYLFRFLQKLCGLLPMNFCRKLGSVLGWFVGSLVFSYRRIYKENWAIAFAQPLGFFEQNTLWANLGCNLLASLKISVSTLEQKEKWVRVIGVDYLYEAVRESGGAVFATGHFSCWELLAQIPQFASDLKFSTLYQPLKNKAMDEWMRKERARCGIELISRRGAWKEACEKLRQGQVVAVFTDQHAGKHGIWTPFFGKLASTSPLAALMAKRTQTWIVPAAMRTTKKGWEVEFFPPLKPKGQSVAQLTWQINQQLEKMICLSPPDWLWAHERWKIPNPGFLLKRIKREVFIPEGITLKPFRVLVRGMNWLGDAVMHLGALKNLKMGRPDLHLTLLTPQKLADLYLACDFIDEVETLPLVSGPFHTLRQVWKTIWQIRNQCYDLAVLLPNSYRTVLEVWLGGVRRRVGFRVQGRGRYAINHKIPLSCWEKPYEHQALRWLKAVEWLGGEFQSEPYRLSSGPVQNKGLGIIAPGAAYGAAKRWLPERFAQVAQELSDRCSRWIIIGDKNDKPSCCEVANLMPGTENLCGKTNLNELLELLLKADLVLCNDSGVMHLAGLCGTKGVAIFGSTEPQATRARQKTMAYVRHHIACSPCFQRECPLGHFNCLKKVTTHEVVQAVRELLQEGQAGPILNLAWVEDKL